MPDARSRGCRFGEVGEASLGNERTDAHWINEMPHFSDDFASALAVQGRIYVCGPLLNADRRMLAAT